MEKYRVIYDANGNGTYEEKIIIASNEEMAMILLMERYWCDDWSEDDFVIIDIVKC